ncbi:hypothetical protein [Roseibium sp. RKSG952]|uniref:hypothetical protein n=1 Tax=Roseibium sp. RKSG952 TaxID=2529384 RepID=UPI0012BC58DA|nr:hypothetical protein [Roseibium sp. RKSG952]MTH94745.1 hypothetical protein [Roseibium sp. RKSG952]
MNMDLGDTRLIVDACKNAGCLRNQAAYILATAYWETARTMKPVVEAFWLSENWRQNNLRYYPWHGRGYVQLTWKENYRRAQERLGIPFAEDPKLAMVPEHAAKILVTGCVEGWFTGKKLADYITLKKSDFFNARRVVNGRDKADQIAALARDYDRALEAESYGVADAKSIPIPEAKPKIHKPLTESKELIGGVAGLVAAFSAFLEQVDGNTVALILGALALGFIANRLYARRQGAR